jgi:hypothetical protein
MTLTLWNPHTHTAAAGSSQGTRAGLATFFNLSGSTRGCENGILLSYERRHVCKRAHGPFDSDTAALVSEGLPLAPCAVGQRGFGGQRRGYFFGRVPDTVVIAPEVETRRRDHGLQR